MADTHRELAQLINHLDLLKDIEHRLVRDALRNGIAFDSNDHTRHIWELKRIGDKAITALRDSDFSDLANQDERSMLELHRRLNRTPMQTKIPVNPLYNLKQLFASLIVIDEIHKRLENDIETNPQAVSLAEHESHITILANTVQDLISNPRVPEWLEHAEKDSDLTFEDRANLKLMKRTYAHNVCLPAYLTEEINRSASYGARLHAQALKNEDHEAAYEQLSLSLNLARTAAKIKQQHLGLNSPYDALLDQYSPGWTTKDYDHLFNNLESFLKELTPQVLALQLMLPKPRRVKFDADADQLKVFCRDLISRIGYDPTRGSMEIGNAHPIASGSRNDARITARLNADHPLETVYAFMHEAGHAIYLQNTPARLQHEPVGQIMGMDIHESQSLIWEFVVGKSKGFNEHLSQSLKNSFGERREFETDNLYALATYLRPSLVRISSDTTEINYLQHIILRYRLEKDLIEGALEIEDLPKAWNQRCKETFGIAPSTPAESHLQDVHWMANMWGYFPSYAIGLAAATQMYDAAITAHPDLEQQFSKGNFSTLTRWLNENVHSNASLYSAPDLIRHATGRELDAQSLKDHLKRRYLDCDIPRAAYTVPQKKTLKSYICKR